MVKPQNLHILVLRTAAVLMILLMLSTRIVVGRYARYTSSATGHAEARVAAFDVSVAENLDQLVAIPIEPGMTAKKNFTVTNRGEVAVALRFQVSSQYNNLPLEIQNLLSAVVAPGETKSVPLEITWPDSDRSDQYIGMVDLLHISIQVEQVD